MYVITVLIVQDSEKLMINCSCLGIKEGLRIHPSVPTGLPRKIPRGGNVVLGKWIPGGTSVVVHQTAAFRSSANFK